MGFMKSWKLTTVGVGMAIALALSGAGLAGAQADDEIEHPVYIHEGTCDEIDQTPAATLNPVTVWLNDEDDDDNTNEVQGSLGAGRVLQSASELSGDEYPFGQLIASDHVIAVYESETALDDPLACGEVGGIIVDSELLIGLGPAMDSEYYGLVQFEDAQPDQDGDSDVYIYLVEPEEESAPPEDLVEDDEDEAEATPEDNDD